MARWAWGRRAVRAATPLCIAALFGAASSAAAMPGRPAALPPEPPPDAIGYAGPRVQATSEVAPSDSIGAFRTTCTVAHIAPDDPLVFPGQPGKSHLHVFFGNTAVNASSTIASLRATGNSTCRGGTVNRSAYWVPAIFDTATGALVRPDVGSFYYKQGYEIQPSTAIQPLPAGLRMIAGDAANAADKEGPFRFSCWQGDKQTQASTSALPACPPGTTSLLSELWFPQCWDGRHLDSPDHKSHMSYVAQDRSPPFAKHCPESHPVALPAISFNLWYHVTSGTASWRLSSDMYDRSLPAGRSMHGDWMNGWDPEISDAWAHHCIQASRDCHSHLLGDGRAIF